jgi:hypothetical protein
MHRFLRMRAAHVNDPYRLTCRETTWLLKLIAAKAGIDIPGWHNNYDSIKHGRYAAGTPMGGKHRPDLLVMLPNATAFATFQKALLPDDNRIYINLSLSLMVRFPLEDGTFQPRGYRPQQRTPAPRQPHRQHNGPKRVTGERDVAGFKKPRSM